MQSEVFEYFLNGGDAQLLVCEDDKEAIAALSAAEFAGLRIFRLPDFRAREGDIPTGQLHVQATFNNTIITFADSKGNALTAASADACGFRGSKKGTAYAAQIAAEKAAEAAKSTYGLRTVDVFVKGVVQNLL